jgi:hypothetical protein
VVESQLFFELLMVLFYSPAEFGQSH